MRMFVLLLGLLVLGQPAHASPKLTILVSIDNERMDVEEDGVVTNRFTVSTARPPRQTITGTFEPFKMYVHHISGEFKEQMPHSIFFGPWRRGFAIHGTEDEAELGKPVSHGCVRLSRKNAGTLYALVVRYGMKHTRIIIAQSIPMPPSTD